MTQREIREFSDQIAQRFSPDKIILFGSQANGTARKDSDLDALVVMNYDGPATHKAAEIHSSINPNFSCDLMVRNAAEVEERVRLNDYFFRDLLAHGKTLYEATHANHPRPVQPLPVL